MSNGKPYYLSGPMSGLPDENHPLFNQATEDLREKGFEIITPIELDADDEADMSYWDKIGRDVTVVAEVCGGIIFLPEWQTSRGARLEALAAMLCGHQMFMYRGKAYGLFSISKRQALRKIQHATE